MTVENDFLAFATNSIANVLSQSQYVADTAVVQNGFVSGIVPSAAVNKVWRQSSIIAAMIAQFIVDQSGQPAIDDGTTATLEANLLTAIRNATKTGIILADTGAANAYTAASVPPLVAGTWVDGVVQQVKIAHANTAASTYSPDTLTAIPIYGLGLQPLQGGELAVGGTAILMRTTIAGVNSGNPIAVLMECAGGAQQVAPATQSQHAVQLGQIGHGQCRLSVTNGTTLTLSPYNGNNISINGVPRQVPLAGVTGSNAGLTASTLYYVYASWTGAAIQLNFSTTGHSTASNGVEIKTGDGTQTLVGMIRTFTDGTFINTSQYSYLLNWFNRKTIAANINGTSVNFSNTGALAEISATYRVNFLTWADEAVYSQSDGGYTNNGINDNKVQNWIDGSSFGPAVDSYIPVANTLAVFVSAGAGTLSEGFHYSTLAGAVTAGTASISTLNMKVTVRG